MFLAFINKLKNWLYLFIPICCILFWAFIALYKDGFTLIPAADFPTFYYVAQLIFTQPEQIYFLEVQPYTYTPFFATIIAPIALLTFEQAHLFYFFLILILTELCLVLFNQILQIKNISNKFHRFLYLVALSNGIIFVQMFDTLTGRIFTAFGLLWFLKREIKFRELNKDTSDLKFIFIQMMILIFAIGMTLQYIFLIFLYLFQKVKFKEIFSKIQIKRYLILIATFFIQNFMIIVIFLISPQAIQNLLGGSWRGERSLSISRSKLTYSYIERERPRDPVDGITIIIYVLSIYYDLSNIDINLLYLSVIFMSIITIIINSLKKLTIENKFGLWALLSLFFFTFTQDRYFVGLLPLISLLFINYDFVKSEKIIEFVKKNYLILIGLINIILLYSMPPIHYLIRVFPFIYNVPIGLLFMRYIFIYLIIIFDLILLNRKKKSKN